MEQRELGRTGIKVSAIGLGLMSMSGIYGNANDEESIRVIHYALDKGINHLDSSDMYGWGHNEELLGRALKGRRDGVRALLVWVAAPAVFEPRPRAGEPQSSPLSAS